MPHVFETAPTGRAKCRGCGGKIEAGSLRFGESLPNPFAEGETLHWFHPECGAFKRPEPFREALEARAEPLPDGERLDHAARAGVAHPRLARVSGAERAPTARAQCRHCREPIAKDAWRIALVFWEEGRFNAAGYLHPRCASAYFEAPAGEDEDATGVIARVRRFAPALGEEDLREIAGEMAGSSA